MPFLRVLRHRSWKTFVLALASLVVATAVWSINGGRDQTIPPGTPFRHDDFVFNVRSSRRMAGAKGGPTTLLVRLEIRNEARRVAYTFRPDTGLIVDDKARLYRPNPGPPGPCGPSLPAGTTCLEPLTFEVPEDARGLRLRLDVGGVGDTLERLFHGWKWVDLEPSRPH